MKKKRRDFLKISGLAGISVTGTSVLSGCNIDESTISGKKSKEWSSDPEWREVKYGAWNDPGVPLGPGPMDHVLLKDYAPKSTMVAKKTFIPKSKYPAIDVHVHHYYPERVAGKTTKEALAEWVENQEEAGIEKSVVLTGATGDEFDRMVELFLEPYPDRFQLYCGLEINDLKHSNFPERVVTELERCYRNGARGVGELSDKGFGLTRNPKLPPNERLHHDDARLDPFWRKCAELNLPVNVHIADHPSAWLPPDVFQERTPVFQQFNQYEGEGLPYEDLVSILPKLLKKHPETTFIACHLANMGHDLGRLGTTLDTYSNLYLDISARDYELGRQPRGSGKFLTEYSDRILFGTDMGMKKSMYQNWWRLLESADEHMTGRVWWRYYGLELPANVLEAIYRGNARRVLNWGKV